MSKASRAGPLWRVSIETTPESEDAVAALLESLTGQPSSIFTDAETNETSVSVFLPRKAPRLRSTLQQHLSQLGQFGIKCGSARISIRRVRKEDWAESWKRHFKPFTVGSRLLVKPSWSQRNPRRSQQTVIIDPGLSFGTGQHPTTRFCLEQLVEARDSHKQQSFLDIGTGSGILAIAAAKLGYVPVEALDFDPAAVRVANENARKNRVRVKMRRRDITKPERSVLKYDVICANLTADLLASCARTLKSFLKSDGLLILAGILRAQMAGVIQQYKKSDFFPVNTAIEGEWASLVLRKRK